MAHGQSPKAPSPSHQPAKSSTSQMQQASSQQLVPEIPKVTDLQPGSKGRNCECFSGIMQIFPGSPFYKRAVAQE